jgi:hypothetical protein
MDNTCTQKSVFYGRKLYFGSTGYESTRMGGKIRKTTIGWHSNIKQFILLSTLDESKELDFTINKVKKKDIIKTTNIRKVYKVPTEISPTEISQFNMSDSDDFTHITDEDTAEDTAEFVPPTTNSQSNMDEPDGPDEPDDSNTERATPTRIEIDTLFYRLIDKLSWCDRDEGARSVRTVSRALTKPERRYVIHYMTEIYIPQLFNALSGITAFDELTHIQRMNMFAHIIGKGKLFNNGIQQNPDVSIYLIDQFYDLYTFLRS